MDIQQLRNLDFNDVAVWPLPVKIAAIILLSIAVLGAGFWFDTRSQLKLLEDTRDKEKELKEEFETKMRKAANLDGYKAQMEEMERSFGAMLRQLPGKTEIAELLVDISQAGLANGLEFELFKPEEEVPAEFYAELPIKIKVTGDYHDFGNFVSDVAALPRIVTLHNINISPQQENKDELIMEATAKTYRYMEEEEQEDNDKGKKK
jgi:type IV pilus assembly protein PilO